MYESRHQVPLAGSAFLGRMARHAAAALALLAVSPSRRHRSWLYAAAGLEAITSASGFAHWFLPVLLSAGR